MDDRKQRGIKCLRNDWKPPQLHPHRKLPREEDNRQDKGRRGSEWFTHRGLSRVRGPPALFPTPHTGHEAVQSFQPGSNFRPALQDKCPGRSPREKPWALLRGTEDEKEQQLSQERNIQKGSIPGKSSSVWQRVGGREVASAGLLPRVPLVQQSLPGSTAPAAFQGRLCWGGEPHLRRNPRGGLFDPLRLHSSVTTREKQALPRELAGGCGESHGSYLKPNGTKPQNSLASES